MNNLDGASNRRLRVFLCYAAVDEASVRIVYKYLQEEETAPWLDGENLLPGENIELEVEKAINKSDVVLIFLSKAAFNDKQSNSFIRQIKLINKVAKGLLDESIFRIPVKIDEDFEIPLSLKLNKLTYYNLAKLARNNFKEEGYTKLRQALQTRAAELGVKLGKNEQPPQRISARKALSFTTASFLGNTEPKETKEIE